MRWDRVLKTAALTLGAVTLSIGCVKTVDPRAKSGADAKYKGAKEIKESDANEWRAKGIVTYPGGDRVDWKSFTIPEGKKGKVKVKVRYRTPRPGLDLAFDVYDQYYHRVGRAKPDKRGRKSSKTVKFKDAEGKYYVQIYAPRPTDAAEYSIEIEFKERKVIAQVDPKDIVENEIADPPTLPAVPEPPPAEDPNGAGGPGDQNQPPVPTPPVPDPNANNNTPPPEDPPVAAEPVKGKVTNIQKSSNGQLIITINKGKKQGIDRGWEGSVLQGDSDDPLDGGDFKVIKVTSRECVAKVKLTYDQMSSNRYVLITPP